MSQTPSHPLSNDYCLHDETLKLMAAILLAGLNHRTATIDIRERFSAPACGADAAHDQGGHLAARPPAQHVVITGAGQIGLLAAQYALVVGAVPIIVDPVDERVADGVLHVFRFFMHFVPRHLERRGEKELDQAVSPQES